ncbi:putative tail protein [Rhizobium phage RHEph12]|nr:putative tail protein [Rhizobium phage RHEph12]
MAIATSPTNFHDSIRNMFTSSSGANSTGSIAYQIESLVGGGRKSQEQQQRQNTLVLKMMTEQTRLLKKIADSSGGGLASGISTIDDLLDIFAHGKGKFRGLARRLKSVVKLPVLAMGMLVGGVTDAFGVIAAAGKNILKPLVGLKNLINASGMFKVFGKLTPLLKVFPKLLGKLFIPITIIMGIVDAFSGWSNASEYLGKLNVSFGDKAASAIGTLVNGLLLGIPNWLLEQFGGTNLQKLMMHAKDGIWRGITALGSGLGTITEGAFNWISKQVSDIRQYLPTPGQVADMAWAAFDSVKTAVWDGLTYIGTSIRDGFYDFFKNMGDAIKEWWKNPFGPVPNMFNGISSGSTSQTPGAQIGRMFRPQQQSAPVLSGGGASPTNISFRAPNSPYDIPATQSEYDSGGAGGGWRPGMGASAPDSYYGGGGVGAPSGGPTVAATGKPTAPRTVPQDASDFKPGMNYADISTVLVNKLKQDFGVTEEQAYGVIGNFGHETDGFRANQEYNPLGGGRGGFGLAMWTGPRRKAFEAWAAQNGLDPADRNIQYQWFKKEVTTGEYAGVMDKVKQTGNRYESADVFQRSYEKAGVVNQPSRNRYADMAANGYTGPMQSPVMVNGDVPGVTMSNQNSKRSDDIQPQLKANVRDTVTQALGADYKVDVYSGGQSATSNGRTGSNRHNDGHAGDVRITRPDGSPLSDEEAAKVSQLYLAKGYGSVGLRMSGGGIHFDDFTKDKLGPGQSNIWNYNKDGGYFPADLQSQVARGLTGERPAGLRYTDAEMAAMKNKGSVGAAGLPSGPGLGALVKEHQQPPSTLPAASAGSGGGALPTYDSLMPKNAPAQAELAPVQNPQTGGVSADSNGNKNGPFASGDLRVKDVPSTDEWKMMFVNGSAVT